MSNHAGLTNEFLDSARRCSRRSTHVLMAIQVFSILLAAMLVNSVKWNWTESRFHLAQNARTCLGSGTVKPFAPPLSETDRKDAREFLYDERYDSVDVADLMKQLKHFRFENVTTFPIPFTGVRVDVNALGLVAGIGLSVLLGWLYLSLARERHNLPLIEEKLGPDGIHILCMESFFNPETCEAPLPRTHQRFRRFLPAFALAFPAILLGFIIVNDLLTFERGYRVNPDMTIFNTTGEAVFLFWTLLFVCLSVREYVEMRRWWLSYPARAQKPVAN